MNDVHFRPWAADDREFLWEMLYQSLHVRDGGDPFPRSVLDDPVIAHYLRDFGSHQGDDAQICINEDGTSVGAAWCRRMTASDPGYGFVDDTIPELGMAVVAERRGQGLGRRLLEDLLVRHPAMSLSVDDQNVGAAALYRSLGFVAVESDGGSTTMLRTGASNELLDEFARFRADREAELVEPFGWLTLRGFHWLTSEPSGLPGLPGHWWTDPAHTKATVEAGVADGLKVGGAPLDGTSTLDVAEYGRVPWVDHGPIRVELLRRGGRLAIRLRSETSPDREAFTHVPTFPYDPAWRLTARFTAFDDQRAVEVETIRPDLRQVAHPFGEVSFIAGGVQQRLVITKGKYGWGVQFHDPTNGASTEQWRQLHFDPPTGRDGIDDRGADGNVVLDFNRSMNMWFAFTAYATCPAPIVGNTLSVPVRAGERRVSHNRRTAPLPS